MFDLFSFMDSHWDENDYNTDFYDHHPLEDSFSYGYEHHEDTYSGETVIGDPYQDMQFAHMQEGMNSCAVAAQKEIIQSMLGKDIPEIELSYMAYKNGWYDPSAGTMPDNMGKLLEAYGIPVDRGYDYSLSDIGTALEKGEKVIVGLNSNEIWNPQYDEAGNPIKQATAGHAVWVTGLYQDDNGKWFVVMNDTGIPGGGGKGETVGAEDFLNAWNDFDNFAVITNKDGESIKSNPFATSENKAMLAGYYNSDGTYHYESDNTDRDPETGAIIRRY